MNSQTLEIKRFTTTINQSVATVKNSGFRKIQLAHVGKHL
jgi:hypothetical protein